MKRFMLLLTILILLTSCITEYRPEEHTFITNPTSGAELFVNIYKPSDWNGEALPTIILIPGGSSYSSYYEEFDRAQTLSEEGFTIITFDPDGRGKSGGFDDQNGFTHQDGLAAIIEFVATLPEVDPNQMGIFSQSYGVTLASGVLARYPQLPLSFLIDYEGPANRDDTGGCDEAGTGHLQDLVTCDDEMFWAEHEAETFISQIHVPYQRLQKIRDHAQPDYEHTIIMNNAAVEGLSPWVRLNYLQLNIIYTEENLPPMLSNMFGEKLLEELPNLVNEMLALPY
ncbi:MAG: CocE/NonD family hydrolase [archaeon]